MNPTTRQLALRTMVRFVDDLPLCRRTEAECHSVSRSIQDYHHHVTRAINNLKYAVTRRAEEIVRQTDDELSRNTAVSEREDRRMVHDARFESMLQEKCESLDDPTIQAMVVCRR